MGKGAAVSPPVESVLSVSWGVVVEQGESCSGTGCYVAAHGSCHGDSQSVGKDLLHGSG